MFGWRSRTGIIKSGVRTVRLHNSEAERRHCTGFAATRVFGGLTTERTSLANSTPPAQPTRLALSNAVMPRAREVRGVWSVPEHERFIEAMALYPCGPWKLITDHVGTRSIKQVQTHAQKYQQKLMRHQRGLRKRKTKLKRPEHRVDETTLDQFTHKCIVRYAQRVLTTGKRNAKRSDEEEDEEESSGDDSGDESSVPQSPETSDASDAPESPPNFVGLKLAGVSSEEWEEMTEDIANDATFMHLMVDVDPVEPRTYSNAYQDWSEWQFEDLLKPFEDSPFVEGASQMKTRKCTV